MTYDIRPATDNDLEELSRLVNSAYRGESSRAGWTTEADYLDGQRTNPENLRRDIADQERRWMLCLRERASAPILACVYLELRDEGRTCYLGMLTVKPTIQTKGLGQTLLNASEEYARAKGAMKIVLRVVHLRETLLAWYERRGYKRTGQTEPFPYGNPEFGLPRVEGLHFIVFEKDLTREGAR